MMYLFLLLREKYQLSLYFFREIISIENNPYF